MAEVKVLVPGYFLDDPPQSRACSTVTLIIDGKIKLVIDPGTTKNQRVIINALKKEGLNVDDINYVGITHPHLDHYRNIGMFPNAKSIDVWGFWDSDKELQPLKKNFSKNIEIINTPGHSEDALTFVVKTSKGIISICGDVFWKKDYPKKDPYAVDLKKLEKSRKKLLKISDYIIPGHANIYKVN